MWTGDGCPALASVKEDLTLWEVQLWRLLFHLFHIPYASGLIGPIVYSLHPDTKDIKLTDQRSGARAQLINGMEKAR